MENRVQRNYVARFSFSYSDLPKTQPAFEPRTLEDDELSFDPKTLQSRRAEPVAQDTEDADIPPEEDAEDDAQAQAQGRFSLGNE
jgi:hypothetical protein